MISEIYDHFYDTLKSGDFLTALPKTNEPNSNDLRFYSCFAYDNAQKGGLQVQLSAVDKELLLDAKENWTSTE